MLINYLGYIRNIAKGLINIVVKLVKVFRVEKRVSVTAWKMYFKIIII